jgi:hypothetical protein
VAGLFVLVIVKSIVRTAIMPDQRAVPERPTGRDATKKEESYRRHKGVRRSPNATVAQIVDELYEVRNFIVHGDRIPDWAFQDTLRDGFNGRVTVFQVLFEAQSFIIRRSLLKILPDNLPNHFGDAAPLRPTSTRMDSRILRSGRVSGAGSPEFLFTVKQLDTALAALTGVSGNRTRTRSRLFAAARARIAAAQRARWAKVRGNAGQKQNVVSMPKKKTMSAAARRKIAAAQRARWAKIKAAKKKSA